MKCMLPELIKEQFEKSYEFRLNYKGKVPLSEEAKSALKVDLERKLNFWEIGDDHELANFLFDSMAEIDYCLTEQELYSLPKPYWALVLVMSYELAAQSGGWVALSNQGRQRMMRVVEAYDVVGFPDVAKGLLAATEAYKPDMTPGTKEFYTAVAAAYAQHVDIGFDEDCEKRMPGIVSYARRAPLLAQ